METYKLRYNLYNYLIDNDTTFNLTIGSKNVSKYFIIAIYIFFILIIISDTSKISYIVVFFIIFGILFIYLTFIIDNKMTKIIENKDFIDFCILFRLFNCIFIDSYNSNKIPIYIKYDLYPSISKTTLTKIKDNIVSANTAATAGPAANAATLVTIGKYYKEIVAAAPGTSKVDIHVENPTINNGILFDTPYLKDNEKTEMIRILKLHLIAENQIIIRKIINRTFIIVFKYDYITDTNIKNIYEFLDDNYKNFSNFITKINEINNYIYVIDLETLEYEKNKSIILKNIYNNLKTYFIQIHTSFTEQTSSDSINPNNDKLTTLITNPTNDNNYLKTFYNTLVEINTNIKYDDNIGKDNIYSYSEELINNKSILKFINIYNNDKYKILKKYIFIKINNSNTYIKDGYSTNEDLKINPSITASENISTVIIDISLIYVTSPSPSTFEYFLLDIETINKYVKDDRFHINEYILKIYDDLLQNYNNRLDLNNSIENFDILFKEIVPDKKIQEPIKDYLYIYNIIIIVFIILMTIILHIIYIELFRFL